MRILSARVHGYFDYFFAALFLLVPLLANFPPAPLTVSFTMAGIIIGLSLVTAYPLGAVRIVSFRTHGRIDAILAASLFLLALTWAPLMEIEFYFLALALALTADLLLTDFDRLSATRISS